MSIYDSDKERQKRKDDKFIPGTIESSYDNYLSSEEEIDEKEMNNNCC